MANTSILDLKNKEISDLYDRIEALSYHDTNKDYAIAALNQTIAEMLEQASAASEEFEALRQECARLEHLHGMNETVMQMDEHRAKMVEEEFKNELKRLQTRLAYFEASPLKAGLKHLLLDILRTVRKFLPLPQSLKGRLSQKMTSVAVSLHPPRPVAMDPVATEITTQATIDFAFPVHDNPVISIIVPVYNEISQTIACLRSIYQQKVSVPYEVILADDCSPDPFSQVLDTIEGLRYFRNPQNLHFLRNCNRNAEFARGDYLVFLNNDTIAKPGWLQRLYDTFFEHDDVGIVGSKLLFPTGELQEAGGVIWEDGSGWNWGRAENADNPLYNFVRDVDYISGASLMVSTKLWKEVGGFSEDYEKAYYEDTDLCFQIREMGYRIIYQPESELIHIEGLSSGTDLNAGVKQYQTVNKEIFVKKWAHVLKHHLPNATTPFQASDRIVRGHVLYIDATTPEPDKDSGSLDAVYAMRILRELGYRVHFVPCSNFAYFGQPTRDLQKMGIETVYHPFYSNMDQYLSERGDMFDYVVLSRPESADRCLDIVKKRCPSAHLIYNTVDLHFMRLARRAERTDDKEAALHAAAMKKKELDYIEKTDGTIVLSTVEREVLLETGVKDEKLWTIPLIRAKSERLVDFESTRDIAFIGGYRHPPNVDAVDWLVTKIWPQVRKSVPGVKLHICGSAMPEHFYDYAADDIIIRGFIPNLEDLLSTLRMTIAPLRFGAGLKGKVASSIGAGVPCIGTSIAFEGMAEEGLSGVKLETETPKGFAKIIADVYDNEEKWTKISHAGVAYHNQNYAYRNVMKTYEEMLTL